jgi:hypothetical protein
MDGWEYQLSHNLHCHTFEQTNFKSIGFAIPIVKSDQPQGSEVYISTGKEWGNLWKYVVGKNTGKLWVEIKYSSSLPTEAIELVSSAIFLLPFFLLTLFLLNFIGKIIVGRF